MSLCLINLRTVCQTLRVHQYAKNLLIFAPWLLGHQYGFNSLLNCMLAFINFCLLASSVYILNDLVDLPHDRLHQTKKNRPLASGKISVYQSIALGMICFCLAIALSFFLPPYFQWILLGYFLLTSLYTFWLKRKLLIDVIILSALYTVRILSGAVVSGIVFSPWLVAFSLFIFTSLAFLKRFIELDFSRKGNLEAVNGRGYDILHIDFVRIFGIVSGYISILVFVLYLNSDTAMALYQNPTILYAICPLLIYWVSRIWLLASSGLVDEDPVMFVITDKATYIVLVLVFLIGVIATVWK